MIAGCRDPHSHIQCTLWVGDHFTQSSRGAKQLHDIHVSVYTAFPALIDSATSSFWHIPIIALPYTSVLCTKEGIAVVSNSIIVLSVAMRNGDMRLARGSISSPTYSSGRLEIYINGEWGTVCGDSFSFTNANVACQQLGYSGASRNPITASDNSSWVANVQIALQRPA